MEILKRKYLFLKNLLTSSYSQRLIVFVLLGLILITFGVLTYKTELFSNGDKIEVLNDVTESQKGQLEIVVEISGAVEKPGVYKMKNGDRVEDLLIASGGLSLDADRDWVTKNVNRAAKLVDSQKIYIYHSNELSANKDTPIKLDHGVLGTSDINSSKTVNINTASQSELENLDGIGRVYALNIIEHRPYSDTKELVSKDVISQKLFEKIENEISVY